MNEVTNRQVFVVNSTNTVTAKPHKAMNKIGFQYTELNGKKIMTDTIQLGQIRHIRITKPSGAVFKKWTFSVPDSSVLVSDNQGKNFQVFMHFKDFMGYDQYHEKFASITLTNRIINAATNPYAVVDPTDGQSTTVNNAQKAFAYEMKKRINAQYINGFHPVNVTVEEDSTTTPGTTIYKIVLKEDLSMQYPTLAKMSRRIFPAPCNMYVTTNILEGEDDSWSAEVAAAGNKLKGVDDVVFKNSYLVWRMERQAVLDRNEMTLPDNLDPFVPAALVMDNEVWQTSAATGTDYLFLDIAYWTQPKDVTAAVNNKEITFCATSFDTLKAIADNIGTKLGDGTGIDDDHHVIAFEPFAVLPTA